MVIKWVIRVIFGICLHKFKWRDPEQMTIQGKKSMVQVGNCKWCGKFYVREIRSSYKDN